MKVEVEGNSASLEHQAEQESSPSKGTLPSVTLDGKEDVLRSNGATDSRMDGRAGPESLIEKPFMVNFEGRNPEEVASEFKAAIFDRLKAMTFTDLGEISARGGMTRGVNPQPCIRFEFHAMDTNWMGTLTEGGSVDLNIIPDTDMKTLSINYGDKTYIKGPNDTLIPGGDNIDVIVSHRATQDGDPMYLALTRFVTQVLDDSGTWLTVATELDSKGTEVYADNINDAEAIVIKESGRPKRTIEGQEKILEVVQELIEAGLPKEYAMKAGLPVGK